VRFRVLRASTQEHNQLEPGKSSSPWSIVLAAAHCRSSTTSRTPALPWSAKCLCLSCHPSSPWACTPPSKSECMLATAAKSAAAVLSTHHAHSAKLKPCSLSSHRRFPVFMVRNQVNDKQGLQAPPMHTSGLIPAGAVFLPFL